MKRIVFFVLSMFLVFPLSAQIVDFDLAKQKAQAFFFVNDDSGSLLKSATEVKVDSSPPFYIKGGLEKSGKTENLHKFKRTASNLNISMNIQDKITLKNFIFGNREALIILLNIKVISVFK
jgi:hypothetical protein